MDHQNQGCAICGQNTQEYRLGVDHCHKTNVVRGILCYNCNRYLVPLLENKPENVLKAIEYLKNAPAKKVLGKEHKVPSTNFYRWHKIETYLSKKQNA